MLTRIFAAVLVVAAGLAPTASLHAQYYQQDDRGYGPGPGQAVDCKSSGYNYQRCPVPWRDAQIARQLSDTQCRRGQNWGFDRRGFVWVDRGCQARFVEAGGYGDRYPDQGGWRPGPGWNQRFSIRCESTDGQNRFCQVDVGGGGRVYLERQESRTPCYEGQNWGWNRGGVWVSQGCRGVFTIDRRW